MNDDRMGGIALIAGTAGMLVIMALHPTGRELFTPGQLEQTIRMSQSVHTLAIACLPIHWLGALALSRWLASSSRLEVAALVVYTLSSLAALMAAVPSGFLAPGIARVMLRAQVPATEAWRAIFDYNGRINQAYARIWIVALSAAVVLWSVVFMRRPRVARAIGIYGVLIGAVVALAVGIGHLRLDVHGAGIAVLAQAAWFFAAGILLWAVPRQR